MEEKKVVVYTTPTCMYCNMLKAFFDEKEVKYEMIDVSVNTEKAKYLAEKTGQLGVPVTEIDGEFIIGFDQEKISEILGLN
jgi:glutaredoxin-like YruB-family protein